MQSEGGEDVGSQCSLICQQVVLKKLREELRPSVREEREISLLLITFFLLNPCLLTKHMKGNEFYKKAGETL